MQLVDQKNDVQIVGGGQTSQCELVMDGHMFSVLSGLYSNRIVAVVREISTNAYDAHVEAGTPDKPFDVHLPTMLEPWFSVRDYGPGMDNDRLDKVYRVYGKSTKRGSNDGVGCLGLGSKSPFCYTSAFTVTSYHDRKMIQLAGHLNDDGIPSFTVMQECDTLEPNGVEVRVATKTGDVESFKQAALNVYRYFDVKPSLSKAGSFVDLALPVAKAMFKRSLEVGGRKIDYKVPSLHTGVGRVIMGPVPYPIDLSALGVNYATSAYKLVEHGVEIKVPIGSLNIAPSREALKYAPGTISTLKEILDGIVKDIIGQSDDLMKNVDNLWKARCVVSSVLVDLSRIVDTSNFKLDYKGAKLSPTIRSSNYPKINFERFRKGYKRSDFGVHRTHGCAQIDAGDNVVIVRSDLKTGNIGRVAYFTSLQDDVDVYLVHGEVEDVDQFIKDEELEGVVKKTSELSDIPPTAKTARKARSKNPLDHVGLMKFDGKKWEAVATPPDTGVYAVTQRYNVTMLDKHGNVCSIDQGHYGLIEVIKRIQEVDKAFVLYGIRPKKAEKMEKQTGWIRLEDYLRKLFKDGAERTKKYGAAVNVLGKIDSSSPNIFRVAATNFKEAKTKVSRNGAAYKAFDAFDKAFTYDEKTKKEGEALLALTNAHYSVRSVTGTGTKDLWEDKVPSGLLGELEQHVADFKKAYPLVCEKTYYSNPCNPDKITENFLDYLRGMDALRSKKLAHVRKMKVT